MIFSRIFFFLNEKKIEIMRNRDLPKNKIEQCYERFNNLLNQHCTTHEVDLFNRISNVF